MADKQIKDLDLAAVVEDTDSIPLQTVTGLTKRFTPATLTARYDNRYEKQGTLIYADYTFDRTGTTISFSVSEIFLNRKLRLMLSNMYSDDEESTGLYGAQYITLPPISETGGPPFIYAPAKAFGYAGTEGTTDENIKVEQVFNEGETFFYFSLSSSKIKIKEVWVL